MANDKLVVDITLDTKNLRRAVEEWERLSLKFTNDIRTAFSGKVAMAAGISVADKDGAIDELARYQDRMLKEDERQRIEFAKHLGWAWEEGNGRVRLRRGHLTSDWYPHNEWRYCAVTMAARQYFGYTLEDIILIAKRAEVGSCVSIDYARPKAALEIVRQRQWECRMAPTASPLWAIIIVVPSDDGGATLRLESNVETETTCLTVISTGGTYGRMPMEGDKWDYGLDF